jgi:hypothetical protein
LDTTNTVKASKRNPPPAKKAKRMKPPTRMVKTAGAKKFSFKHASKRKSTRCGRESAS